MLTVHYQISVNPHSAHEQVHLSAEQLWSGLLLRIVEPERFTIGLDRAEVAQISDVRYQRTLFFGEHAIRDEVVLTPIDDRLPHPNARHARKVSRPMKNARPGDRDGRFHFSALALGSRSLAA